MKFVFASTNKFYSVYKENSKCIKFIYVKNEKINNNKLDAEFKTGEKSK